MAAVIILIVTGVLVWLQSVLYKRRWNRNTTLELFFSEKAAAEGETLYLTEILTNRKLLPLPWVAVKFQVSRHLRFTDHQNAQVSDDYYRHDLFNLLMFQRITRKLPFICARRGFYTVKSAELISGDLLARSKFAAPVRCQAALTVYPRLIDIDAFTAAHRTILGNILAKRFIQPDPFEFKGIREYQPHDSLRTVNFKATAKTGQLMVNVNDYTVSQEVVLILSLQKYNAYPDEFLYEQAIRLSASLADYYVNNGIPLSFISNARLGDEQALSAYPGEEGIYIAGGSGAGHLLSIYEMLAHIDVKKEAALPTRDLLRRADESKPRWQSEPVYILISTCHDRDVIDAFNNLQEREALWIIPVFRGMTLTVPLSERIVRMEADYD